MGYTKGKWRADIRTGCFAIYVGEHKNCLDGVANDVIVFQMGRGENAHKYRDSYKSMTDEQKANAQRIVTCVNSHDELMEAIKGFKVWYMTLRNHNPDSFIQLQGIIPNHIINRMEQALMAGKNGLKKNFTV